MADAERGGIMREVGSWGGSCGGSGTGHLHRRDGKPIIVMACREPGVGEMKLRMDQRIGWTLPAASALASLLVALSILVQAGPVQAGDVTDNARRAEQLMGAGETERAIGAFDNAAEAFWQSGPVGFRTVGFVQTGSVEGYGRYQPRGSAFAVGEAATIYFEPFGYGFRQSGAQLRMGLTTGVEIRSPGGIVYARAPNLGRLSWLGRTRSREVHGSISLQMPELKPGDYELHLTMKDDVTAKNATTVLPFSIVPAPPVPKTE